MIHISMSAEPDRFIEGAEAMRAKVIRYTDDMADYWATSSDRWVRGKAGYINMMKAGHWRILANAVREMPAP